MLQFAFALQWKTLREAAARSAIRILGDVAIFVNMDSADVWVHPELFELDEELNPIRIAGVPPDYFSPTGQRWGNPLYRWDVLAAHGFDWWIERIRRACALYDIVRLDHFRGFEAYWAIPAEEETAVNGKWVKAPGLELFHALEAALGPLPLVAEDLGIITPEVDALRAGARHAGHEGACSSASAARARIRTCPTASRPTPSPTPARTTTTPPRAGGRRPGKIERSAVEAYVGPGRRAARSGR